MGKKQLEVANRFLRSQFEEAFNKDVLKILTEVITNSDDNYRIMEQRDNIEKVFPITIFFDEKIKKISVLDEGTGMTKKELEKKFQDIGYGGEKSGTYDGYHTRGIFGQGISDVLFYNNKGKIKSISNDEYSICSFIKEGDGFYTEINNESEKLFKEFKKLGFKNNTGTLVEFYLNEECSFPRYETIEKRLREFYMLRLINKNKSRNIKLVYTNKKNESVDATIKYFEPNAEEILNENFDFVFEKYKIKANIVLKKSGESISDDLKGILISDKGSTVCAKDSFELSHEKMSDYIFGELKLDGIRELIKDKMSLENPERILRDSRDGFNKSHAFYKCLEPKVRRIIEPHFKMKNTITVESISISKRDKKVFDFINKDYSEIFGKENKGGNIDDISNDEDIGIKFVRPSISITKGYEYSIGLKINMKHLPNDGIICLKSKYNSVHFTPSEINLKDFTSENIFIKKINIRMDLEDKDVLTAKLGDFSTSVIINCTSRKVIYPENGLIFDPTSVTCKSNVDKIVHLYIDRTKIKKDEKIVLSSTNKKILLINEDIIKVPTQYEKNIAKIKVILKGKEVGEKGIIIAKCSGYEAKLNVNIQNKDKNKNNGGIFKGWDFERCGDTFRRPWRYETLGEKKGFIFIHSGHPINRYYFGDNPTKKVLKDTKAQLYLAELLTDAFVMSQLSKIVDKGISQPDPASIARYIYQKKFDLGLVVYREYVNKKQIQIQDEFLREKATNDSSRNAKIFAARMEGKTMEEIGNDFNIKRQRVQQILKKEMKEINKDKNKVSKSKKIDKKFIEQDKAQRDLAFLEDRNTKIEEIIDAVAKKYHITTEDIKSIRRAQKLVLARHICAFRLRKELDIPYNEIGKLLGGRDHTTIMHGVKKIEKILKED